MGRGRQARASHPRFDPPALTGDERLNGETPPKQPESWRRGRVSRSVRRATPRRFDGRVKAAEHLERVPDIGRMSVESLARQECKNMTASESTATEGTSGAERSAAALQAELTIIVVTWNTRELTLRCLETLFDNTPDLR